MSLFDNHYTLSELVATAQQQNDECLRALALHLCRDANIDPNDNVIGPFICQRLCDSNLHGAELWLRDYLLKEDLMPIDADLHACCLAFRSALITRVPSHLMGAFD